MANQNANNIKLGAFTLAGLTFIIITLYMIGSSRNLFSSNFEVTARFHTVNGLMVGNNVRVSGIDVGTVRRIDFIDDTSVLVVMVIEKKVRKFIKKNSIASVGTDGLIGSKLVNIELVPGAAPAIQSGDRLASQRPIEGDEMLRTLNTTNLNLAKITEDMKVITRKLNSNNSLWSILKDTVVAANLKQTVLNARNATGKIANASARLEDMLMAAQRGEGLLGSLLVDSSLAIGIKRAVEDVTVTGSQLKQASDELKALTGKLNSQDGTLHLVLADTAFRNKINQTMINVERGTKKFDEDMEALKHNFLLRGYFKKLEKEKRKVKK
ncbi:MAG: MCE family protein [Bacteroidetes bacterium]|nr:MCE family protein [Bacteroidota bacterium]